jgi:hypothetical protein
MTSAICHFILICSLAHMIWTLQEERREGEREGGIEREEGKREGGIEREEGEV